MHLANPLVLAVLVVWVACEFGIRIREGVRGKGGTSADRGTRLRHPSYTGLLLIAIGWGIEGGAWPGLALAVLLPLAGFVRRIQVEEQALTDAMGDAYRDYSARTKRLVPGLW